MRRQVEFAALARIATLEFGEIAKKLEFPKAYEVLKRDKDSFELPEFFLWLNELRRLLVGRASGRSEAQIGEQLRDLNRFALAISFRKRLRYKAVVRLRKDGTLCLPSCGIVFRAETSKANSLVELDVGSGSATATIDGSRFNRKISLNSSWEDAKDSEGGWVSMPKVGWFTLSIDPELVEGLWGAKVASVGRKEMKFWKTSMRQACRLISYVEDELWVPIRSLVKSVTPLVSLSSQFASSTRQDALGNIMMSAAPNVGLWAETIVHEAGHTALNLVLDSYDIWETKGRTQKYRSPWRNDLRPVQGMFHGIWAFLGVAEFWRTLLRKNFVEPFEQLARQRLWKTTSQLEIATAQLLDSHEFTESGRRIFDQMLSSILALRRASEDFAPAESYIFQTNRELRQHMDGARLLPA